LPSSAWWTRSKGTSSLMALTSPNCRCTPCAHASPSSCRTPSSSAAPSGPGSLWKGIPHPWV
ncbi:ABCC8 isoform 21, partial [Pan troglodytes]